MDKKKVEANKKGSGNAASLIKRITGNQLFIPVMAIVLLALINLIAGPSFFNIKLIHNNDGNPQLSGSLITILDYGSELAILAIGMTLVTAASGGQDISVGATIAIAGSAMLRILCGSNPSVCCVVHLTVHWLRSLRSSR